MPKYSLWLLLSAFLILPVAQARAATLLSDDFTGTTIDAGKWVENDTGGSGGSVGDITQNGTLSASNSYTGIWGAKSLYSLSTFASTTLEVSAKMTPGSSQLLGYGNYNFQTAGTKAYILGLQGGSVIGTSWNNGSLDVIQTCGAVTSGSVYKMAVVSGGFEMYKDGSLFCTLNTSLTFSDMPIFLEAESTASLYDDILVTGITNASDPTEPNPPSINSATAGDRLAVIAFTPPISNGGSTITGYTVTSSPGSISAFGTSSPITVTGLTSGVPYTFTMTAANEIGTSTASSASNEVTPYHLTEILSESFEGTSIDSDVWAEVDASGLGGTNGSVRQNGNLSVGNSYTSVWGQTALFSQSSFQNTLLEISAVLTRNSDQVMGYGDYNFQTSGTAAYIIGLQSADVFVTSWNNGGLIDSMDCGAITSGATYKMKVVSGGFEVYKNGSLICTLATAVTVNNKPIFFESASTASTFDDVSVVGMLTDPTVPGAPTISSVVGDDGQVTVHFTPPAINGGSPVTGYTVTSSPGSITATGTSSPITVTGLTNDTEYTFSITASNAVGTSTASSDSAAVTPSVPTVPGQVTGLVVTGVNKQALLGWREPDSGGSAITDYVVEYKLASEDNWTTFNDGNSTSLKTVVTGLSNDAAYDFRVSAVNSIGQGTPSATVAATPAAISTLAFVITGESNSGGIAANSDATAEELAPRSAVQIMNLTSGDFLFEDLDIGVNNLRDHAGLEAYYDSGHGFELDLANLTEDNDFPDNPQVYLIKTGQGGSLVSQWNTGGSYWTKFLQRTAAAKNQLPENRQWVVWMDLGANDAVANTPTTSWKLDMIDHINKIKADLPGAIIIMTEFQSLNSGNDYPAFSTAISELAAEEPNVYSVNTAGAEMVDANHWSYTGFKTVTPRMVAVTQTALGLIYPGTPANFSASPIDSTSASLSWDSPLSEGNSSIVDYAIEYKTASDTSWSAYTDPVSTATTATVTGLMPNTNYDFRISALNSSGAGNPALTTTMTSSAPPHPASGGGVAGLIGTVGPYKGFGYVAPRPQIVYPDGRVVYLDESPAGLQTTATSVPSFSRALQIGMSGEDVRQLQIFLNIHGFSISSSGGGMPGHETDYFGLLTQAALIKFQAAHGIEPMTGYFGPVTRSFISSMSDMPESNPIDLVPKLDDSVPQTARDLELDMSGSDVILLQNLLIKENYSIPSGATGYFGSQTKAALAKYQAENGIHPAAGYFGIKTRIQMTSMKLADLWW